MRRLDSIAVLVGAIVGCAAAGCAAQASVDTAWVMPELAPHDDRGVPFAPLSLGGGADRAREDLPRGDYPEVAFEDASGFWRVDERAAVHEARATGRGLFIDFYAEWSEPSRRLEDEVLSDVEARATIMARYVPLRIDVTEESAAGREQLERFGVDALPALVMVDPDGSEVDRVDELITVEALVDRVRRRDGAP